MSELNFISYTQVIHHLIMSCNHLMRQNLLVDHLKTYLACKNSMFFSPKFVLHQNMHMDFSKVIFVLEKHGRAQGYPNNIQAIEAMPVLHTICIDWDDCPDTIWQYNSMDIWEGWHGVEDGWMMKMKKMRARKWALMI